MAADARRGLRLLPAPGAGAPLAVFNRPALSAVAYRIGDYAAFRQAMLQAIPGLGPSWPSSCGRLAAGRAGPADAGDDYGIAAARAVGRGRRHPHLLPGAIANEA